MWENKSAEEREEFDAWLARPLPDRPHTTPSSLRRTDGSLRALDEAQGAPVGPDPRAEAMRQRLAAVQAMGGDLMEAVQE